MDNDFNIIQNIPLIISAFLFFINFILFIWAGIILFTAKENFEKIEKGRKLLTNALIVLFLILLVLIVFYFITFLLRKGEVFQDIPDGAGEFPPYVHLESFPSSPESIDIGNYHFAGPWKFDNNQSIKETAITSILCKKNEEYDILYIGDITGDNFIRNKNYGCWLENCDNSIKNLYVAVLYTHYDVYEAGEKELIQLELNEQIQPVCVE
ncbi:MAG: hypothetical protein ABH956_03620 [Candidatus Nealsonbacteria bacterium]